MAKITTTTNDALKNGPMHVVAPHEPLKEGGWTAPQVQIAAPQPPTQPVVEPQPLKVALIGTAPSSRMLAPFNDLSWKIWACSPGNQGGVLPRVDAWFEIHKNYHWPEYRHYGEPYINWLKTLAIPVYMQDTFYLPNAKILPKDELIAEFGKDFFTSSFAWMMAFAIREKASEIALYGIDMASRDEYILQRPGFYFFKWVATQRGIKVSAPNESDIMQSPGLYGYSEATRRGRKILARKAEIKGRLDAIRAERAKAEHSQTYLEGALEDLDYFESIWIGEE